jgi:hypothetical protein
VRFGNLKHRFVKTTQVQLTLTGPPETEVQGSTLGNHIFNISAASVGNSFKLRIEIPVPQVMINAGLTSPPLMLVEQVLEVIRTSTGLVTLRPHPTNPGNRFVGGFHPRLTSHSVNSAAGHIVTITVDNTFLKVNRIAGVANPGFIGPYLTANELVPGAARHYGCRLTLYEYTGGKPNVWPVLIPPAVKDDVKVVHTLMFFRPASALQYNTLEDASSASLMRYLLDPQPLGAPTPAPAVPFFVDPRKPGTAKIEIVSNCGFERSLSEAKKPMILVSPVPHLSDYGHAGTTLWPRLITSLINALWAENDVGQKVAQGLLPGRTAAGGFSFGGTAVFDMLSSALALPPPAPGKPQPDPLHELYLFDAKNLNDTDQANIGRWFANGGKKLRMIGGGLFHAKMLTLAAQLKSADATVIPASADDWVTNALYRAAVSFHTFDPSSAARPSPGSVSDITRVFLAGAAAGKPGISLQGRDALGAALGKNQDVFGFGAEEFAAGAMLYNASFRQTPRPNGLDLEFQKHKPPETPPPVPVDTQANFLRLITALVGRSKATRHQWAVVGGQDSGGKTDRLATFKGFLQLCIEQGDLP